MPLQISGFTRRAAQATPESSLEDTMRFTGWFLTLIAVIALSGCRPDMPETAFRTTIKVVDHDTGKPVPGALVLVGVRISVEPEFEPPYDWAMAGNRAFTDDKGAVRFKVVKGLYEGAKPTDALWRVLEDRKPKVERKIIGVESGSILVLAPGYGLFHQPFGVIDNPRFDEYLSKRGETMDTFGGWFGRGYRAEDYNYPAVAVKAEELRRNREITVKVGKVTSTGEEHRFVSFMPAIIGYADVTMSKDSGTTRDEKLDIYAFLMSQLEYAVKVSTNPAWREGLAELKKDETLKEFIAWKPADDNHEKYIHDLLTLKALERLTDEHSEVKEYAQAVLEGVKAEDAGLRSLHHFYDPYSPETALTRKSQTALKWGAIGYPENPDNDWDWEDAKAYYRAGDKRKAYKALGHVVHLLQDLGVPMHTRMITHLTSPENRFEAYFNNMAEDLGGLPPQYWQAEESVTAKDIKEKFEAVAYLTFGAFTLDGRTVSYDDYYTQGGILKTPDDDTLNAMGRHLFPKTIAHTAGLMRAFHAQVNPAAYAQAGKPDISGGTTDAGIKKSTISIEKAKMGSVRFEEEEMIFKTPDGKSVSEYISAKGNMYAETLEKYKGKGFGDPELRKLTPPRVRFYDESGKPVKEIAVTVWDQKVFPGTEKDRTTGKPLSTFRQIEESVEISRDGGYAFINTIKREGIFEYMEGHRRKSEWKVYDRAGRLLWERKTDDVALGAAFADTGVLAVVIGGGWGGENDALRIYNKSGALIFLYPDGETDAQKVDYGMLKISRNGRYLATRVTFNDWETATVFFDLKTKKSWRAPHSYLIFEMTDEGSVWCDYYDVKKGERGPVSRINLKTYLGE
jgi:hypothetical protein